MSLNKPRLLNIEPLNYSPKAKKILGEFAVVHEKALARRGLEKEIGKYEILITRLGHHIHAGLLGRAKRLKVIGTATTGLDHIDLVAASELGIKVISLRGEYEFLEGITATAEHAFALALALCRKIPFAMNSVMQGKWNRDEFRGVQMKGKTLGILGYGRLGRMMARYGKEFGMRIIASDRRPTKDGTKRVPLARLLKESDILTVHLPFNEETRGMLGRKELFSMKKGACLINTSRGGVLDEKALLQALERGHLGGAALDVISGELSPEGVSGHPLVKYASRHSNLIITPHIGGATADSMEETEIFIAKKLREYFSQGQKTGRDK